MANADDKPFLITPPPWLVPPRQDDVADADSGTHRMPRDEKAGVVAPPFFPVVPGAAPVTAPAPTVTVGKIAPPEAEEANAPASRAVPTLVFPDGSRWPVGQALLLGRNPAPVEGWPGASLVAIDDAAKTVSKTHAAVEFDGEALRVSDLDSTNGVSLLSGGDELIVEPGVRTVIPAGAELLLGSFAITVEGE